MSNVTELTARLNARTSAALHRASLCLDPELESVVDMIVQRIATIEKQKAATEDAGGSDGRLSGDNTYASALADAQKELEEARAKMDAETVVFVFRRLTSPEYKALVKEHVSGEDGDLDLAAFSAALCAKSFLRVETPAEEVLEGHTWDQLVTETLSDGEFDSIAAGVITHNRSTTVAPFSKRPSGNRKRS